MNLQKCFYIGKMRVSIHLLAFLPVLFLLYTNAGLYCLSVLFCAAFHELGHLLAIIFCGCEVSCFSFLPFGAQIDIVGKTGYKNDIIIASSGPLFNLILCLIFYLLFLFFPQPFLIFGFYCSAFLMIMNLFPVRSFDGGRIVEACILSRFEYEKALKIINFSELAAILILFLFSVVIFFLCSFNLSVCAICIYIFITVYPAKSIIKA